MCVDYSWQTIFLSKAVAAYNTTEGHLQFHPKGRDNGYILTLNWHERLAYQKTI